MRKNAPYQDLTFSWGGQDVLFATGGQLVVGPSDGSRDPQPLLTAALEPATVCDSGPTVNEKKLVAFSRSTGSCAAAQSVYVYDSARRTVKKVLDNAAQPAFSPDGGQLAYVAKDLNGAKQVFTANANGTGVRQRTSGTGWAEHPSWSPTGKRIVFDAHTATDATDAHSTSYVDLASGEVTRVPGTPKGDRPSWQPLRKNRTGRIWGANSDATNIAASRWTWNTLGAPTVPGLMNARSAVLVNHDDWAYALTAPALAGKKAGPVLATPKTGLTTAVKNELKRTLKKGAPVYLMGGASVLTNTVATQVKSLGYTPQRIAGADRYVASVASAKAITATPKYVLVATGTDYHAALAAAAAAGSDGTSSAATVVLSNGNKLTAPVQAYLNNLNPNKTMIIAVGPPAVYAVGHGRYPKWPSNAVYYPVSASTDEATSIALAKFWWSAPRQITLVGPVWRDGVSAAAAMNVFSPLIWTPKATVLPGAVQSYLTQGSASIRFVVTFGGTGTVAAATLDAAGRAISAGAGQVEYHGYYNGVIPTTPAAHADVVRVPR
ncbi:cell wall-binding repeat-containing protein [Streptomyces sp. S6]